MLKYEYVHMWINYHMWAEALTSGFTEYSRRKKI